MARIIRLPTIKRPKRKAREEFAASLEIIGSSLGDDSFSFDAGCPFFANFSPSFGIFVPSLDILATS
jgi:hypothetical protein